MAIVAESVTNDATISPRLLDYELKRRGCDWSDLSRGEHRVNASTVTKLRARQPVRAAVLLRIGRWLAATPVIAELDAVLERPEQAA